MRRHIGRFLELALIAGLVAGQQSAPRERDAWFAMLDGDVRCGSQHVQVSRLPDGNHRYVISTRYLLDLFGSQKQEIATRGEYVVTPALRPVALTTTADQLSGSSSVAGAMRGDVFALSSVRAGIESEREIPCGPERTVIFAASLEDWLAGLPPTTHQATVDVIDEHADETSPITATRVSPATLDAGGAPDSSGAPPASGAPDVVWEVDAGEGSTQSTLTFDAHGVLREVATRAPAMRVIRCTEAEAQDLTYKVQDGREVLSFPLDKPIGAPHRLRKLVVRLTWEDIPFDDFQLTDERQRVTRSSEQDGHFMARVEIGAPTEDPDAATTPVDAAELAACLAETQYIKPSDETIVAAAREATAGATEPAAVVAALSQWVFELIEAELIAETLSGPEVLACRRGKCTEYSTLFASLARSVGIPTRIALGERMAAGRWGGHMWNEAWVGRWVTVDASVNEVGASLALLKFIHSDTLMGTQPLRWALTESLSIAIEEFELSPSELAGDYATGIVEGVYTNVDYVCQIATPSAEWWMEDKSTASEAMIRIRFPEPNDVSLHFVAFALPAGTPPKALTDARLRMWSGAHDAFELLRDEASSVQTAAGHATHFGGLSKTGDPERFLTTEVLWVHGPSGYLLTLRAPEAEHVAAAASFEQLLASFRFLE